MMHFYYHRLVSIGLISLSVVCVLLIIRFITQQRMIANLDKHARLLSHTSKIRRVFKFILLCVGLSMVALVALRPQWGIKQEIHDVQQRDIFIALDVSRSMLATDVKPNRIAFAQKKLLDLIATLGGDRVGLLFFAGHAVVQCPLTSDKELVRMFIERAQDSIGSSSTRLEEALQALVEQIDEGGFKSKIAIIVTDGEDFSSDLASIKKQVQQKDITLITMGIGTPDGGTIPILDQNKKQTLLKDDAGRTVVTKLNEPMLRSLAVQGGGFYVAPTQDDTDIATILAHVEQQEKMSQESQEQSRYIDRYPFFALIAFMALLLEWVL